jgi:hypothetical protein
LTPGVDPASIPPPPGAVFPGQPLTPLHAVIQVSPLQIDDACNLKIGLSAVFRQSSNITEPPSPQSAGKPEGSPFGSKLDSEAVEIAISAVRSAPTGKQYDKLIDLLHILRAREAR